ncbi:MAG: tetratricopeptide repeat protein [bacterium]
MRNLLAVLIIGLLVFGTASAHHGIDCQIAVGQIDPHDGATVPLYIDTVKVLDSIVLSGFVTAFSIEIELVTADSMRAEFLAHVVTLGPPGNAYSRNFSVEYGLPARIDGIMGKNQVEYTLTLTPLAEIDVDLGECTFDHHQDGLFTFQPSANMDLYFLKNSLGDFNFAGVKGLLEHTYRLFQGTTRFTLPGKYNIYLCPCLLPGVIWDDRFATAIDPTRSTAWGIHTIALNTVDPFIVNQLALLRNWGYAPALLSEGLANYESLAEFDMRRLLTEGRQVPLDSLLVTSYYYAADPMVSDRSAATLVAYLVHKDGLDTFGRLYRQADDLNLRSTLEEVYEMPIAEIEKEWLHWVDTVTITPQQLVDRAEMAESMFNYPLMREYILGMAAMAGNRLDSLRFLSLLKRADFYCGDYYDAIDAQAALAIIDSGNAGHLVTLGTYRLMAGYYDQAFADLTGALEHDSTSGLIRFNLALYHIFAGDTAAAVELLGDLIELPSSGGPAAESRIVLAGLYRATGKVDTARISKLLDDAIALLQPSLQLQPSAAALHLWLGMAQLEHGRPDEARAYLETALFLESRPFYIGLIHLWLGKLADVVGNRELALEHYSAVSGGATADYHQREARRYIEKPFSL